MSRFRAACFTLNNYTPEDLTFFSTLFDNVSLKIRYLIFQREVGASGTPHLQGYIYVENPKTLSAWKAFFGAPRRNPHIECARGSPEENKAYCSKDDSRLDGTSPYEFGVPPQQGKREDLAQLVETIKTGAAIRDIVESHPAEFIRYSRGILATRLVFAERRNWKTEVFWLYGPTGTGKSRAIADLVPHAYWKNPTSKWWDGYDGDSDVVIDDYRKDFCTFGDLLRLFDRYPLTLECKGGSFCFVGRRIFVTCPYCPRETWSGRTDEDLAQLLRRIEHIVPFGGVSDGRLALRTAAGMGDSDQPGVYNP